MGRNLKEWEKRIDDLLRDNYFSIFGMPSAKEDERAWAQNELRESGLLTIEYIFHLRRIISTMEYALEGANRRTYTLFEIVKRSPINCNYCMNARAIEQKDKCSEIDYDCVICKERYCPCRNCKNGSNFRWHIVPGQKPLDFGRMQKPLELYPGQCIPLREITPILPILIEHRYTREIVGGLYDAERDMFYFANNGDDNGGTWMDNEEQGTTWRPWLTFPTKKERDAAPWKEPSDEGLTEEELHEKA